MRELGPDQTPPGSVHTPRAAEAVPSQHRTDAKGSTPEESVPPSEEPPLLEADGPHSALLRSLFLTAGGRRRSKQTLVYRRRRPIGSNTPEPEQQ